MTTYNPESSNLPRASELLRPLPQGQEGLGSLKNIVPPPQYIFETKTIGGGPTLARDHVVGLGAKESPGSHRVPA